MIIREDFSDADPGETEGYTFSFIRDIPSGESLASAVFTLTVEETWDGFTADPSPASRLVGAAVIDSTGKKATQRLSDLQPGNRYRLQCYGTTGSSDTPSLYSFVTCRPFDN